MENIVAKKTDKTRRRWDVAIKDRNFDCIRHLPVAETRPEHFDRALADGKVSSNVYLRRIHNHAPGMERLLKSVIPRLQWPKPVFKAKRAVTAEEHAAIVAREPNAERRDFYELLWHTGASQTDAVCLLAEDVDWNRRTISYSRAKLKSGGGIGIMPALIRFGATIEAILKRRPAVGPLVPYLRTVRASDRATEFRQRCGGLEISGVSLQYQEGVSGRTLNLDGTETYDIVGLDAKLKPQQDLTLRISRKDDKVENVPVRCRIDTPIEIDYYQNGGILPYVLRQLAVIA
jgi:hypothetical protein